MVFVIGEIGTNHLGDLKVAKKIIDIAKDAGCDAVKFQKKNVEKIYTKKFLDSPLDSPWGKTQREMRLHREFSLKQFEEINKYCKKKNIEWFVSCWDTESQVSMRKFKTKYNKVASAMLTHKKLLELIAKEKKYTFISTGMSTIKNIEEAIKIFKKYKCPFELMHCHSAYPMPTEEANLNMIPEFRKKFKCKVGYSGHESGLAVSYAASMMEISSLERHITLDRSMYGSDQSASLEMKGMIELISVINKMQISLGTVKTGHIFDEEFPISEKLRAHIKH